MVIVLLQGHNMILIFNAAFEFTWRSNIHCVSSYLGGIAFDINKSSPVLDITQGTSVYGRAFYPEYPIIMDTYIINIRTTSCIRIFFIIADISIRSVCFHQNIFYQELHSFYEFIILFSPAVVGKLLNSISIKLAICYIIELLTFEYGLRVGYAFIYDLSRSSCRELRIVLQGYILTSDKLIYLRRYGSIKAPKIYYTCIRFWQLI